MTEVRKGRRTLLLVALVFASPLLVAALLTMSGWMPEGRRNYGELVEPPRQLEQQATRLNGDAFTWTTPQWHWTLVVRVPEACDAACKARLDQVGNLRISLGRHGAKLRIAIDRSPDADSVLGRAAGVYPLAELPAPVAALLPEAREDLTLGLVDPAGYLMLRYSQHADLARVRKDLGRLIR
jgi:hypothetical protein